MYDEIFSSSQIHFFTIIMIGNKYLCTQIHNSYNYDVKLMCLFMVFCAAMKLEVVRKCSMPSARLCLCL